MADGGEMTTIDGTPVNFITENNIPTQAIIESSTNNSGLKNKINEVVDNIHESDEGIIIQAVDGNNTDLANLKLVRSRLEAQDEQSNKNWLYIAGPQSDGQGISTLPPSSTLEGEEEEATYLIQSPENYKLTLLQTMFRKESMNRFADLVVFCRDGVAWTSKLLMSASSTMVREAFSELDNLQNETSSLVLPDISQHEFNVFHEALFASVSDSKLDLVVVIKVAETLGVDLPITTSLPIQKESSNEVDYKLVQADSNEWKRVLFSLGYEEKLSNEDSTNSTSSHHLKEGTISQLVSIFDTNIACDKCQRTFVNESSLKKHTLTVHNFKDTKSSLSQRYECGKCDQRFAFAINVRKHEWLCHRKGIKHMLRLNNTDDNTLDEVNQTNISGVNDLNNTSSSQLIDGQMDKRTRKKKALQEKMEDMTCKDCGLKCTSWKQLQIHTMDHSNERPFKCKLCKKGFKEPQKLKRHMVSHTREKQFSCKYCKKSFGLKHNMKTHEKIHEGGGHHCSYCDRTFSQGNTLQDHEVKHRKLRHVKTQDEDIRTRQLLKAVRGRPSLKETFAKQGKTLSNEVMDVDKEADLVEKGTPFEITSNSKDSI